MAYDVRLEQHAGIPLAVVRRLAKPHELAKIVPAACGTVWNVIRAEKVAGAGRHVSVYLDNQINVEVGVELSAPFGGSGEVIDSTTPSGLVATTTHYGPYQLLHNANTAIQQWCAKNGHQLAGPSWEVYGHWQDEWNRDPTGIMTDVYYLLSPKSVS